MLENFSDSIKASLWERLSTPFFFCIVLSWIACNWQGLIYLVSAESDITYKIKYIESHYMSFSRNVLLPVMLGFISSILFPWVNYLVFRSQEYVKSLMQKARNDLFQKQTIDSAILAEAQQEHGKVVSNLNNSIGSLSKRVEEYKGEIIDLKQKIRNQPTPLENIDSDTPDHNILINRTHNELTILDCLINETPGSAPSYKLSQIDTKGFEDTIISLTTDKLIASKSGTAPVSKKALDFALRSIKAEQQEGAIGSYVLDNYYKFLKTVIVTATGKQVYYSNDNVLHKITNKA